MKLLIIINNLLLYLRDIMLLFFLCDIFIKEYFIKEGSFMEGVICVVGYWIVGVRCLINFVIYNCVICRKFRGEFCL